MEKIQPEKGVQITLGMEKRREQDAGGGVSGRWRGSWDEIRTVSQILVPSQIKSGKERKIVAANEKKNIQKRTDGVVARGKKNKTLMRLLSIYREFFIL